MKMKAKIYFTDLTDDELDELYRNIRYELELRGMEKWGNHNAKNDLFWYGRYDCRPLWCT